MKRIRVILTTSEGGQELLKIIEPLFVAVVADRFVIEDQRGPMTPKTARDPARKTGKPAK